MGHTLTNQDARVGGVAGAGKRGPMTTSELARAVALMCAIGKDTQTYEVKSSRKKEAVKEHLQDHLRLLERGGWNDHLRTL